VLLLPQKCLTVWGIGAGRGVWQTEYSLAVPAREHTADFLTLGGLPQFALVFNQRP
jgi:hypothetical protein